MRRAKTTEEEEVSEDAVEAVFVRSGCHNGDKSCVLAMPSHPKPIGF